MSGRLNAEAQPTPESGQHSISEPLFDEDPLDLTQQGGIVVLETGQLAEVAPPKFVREGWDDSPTGHRLQPLPIDLVRGEDGSREIRWRSLPYDPETATIGLEMEHLTMALGEREWHPISPDGITLHFPGHRDHFEQAVERGHQPESLKFITESGTDPEKLPQGYEDFAAKSGEEKHHKATWTVHHGVALVPLSVYPKSVQEEDLTEHPYTQMLKQPELMPHYKEYAATTSEQLNIQWKDPEAGAFAINGYQMLQSVLNLVTAASPARDGSLYTTLGEHYGNMDDEQMEALVHKELGAFMDRVPYDWRELARGYGSPSGGAITEAAPVDMESFLRLADRKLRDNEIMTAERTLGWHADRWRIDKGTIEVCNLSHGGDHLDKMPAAEEVVIKTIQALQEYFYDPDADKRYDESWDAVIPRPEERLDIYSRQHFVEAARVNNMLVTMFGKDRNVFDADWQERSPLEIFDAFVDFTDVYAPEPITHKSVEVIRATLEQPPSAETFDKLNRVLEYFYTSRSRMTATEALRMADEKDDGNPAVSMNGLLMRMTDIARQKRLDRRHAEEQAMRDANVDT